MTAPLLRVDGLEVSYGRIQALRGVTIEVHPGELVALVGANGAGKSTLLRALSGLVQAQRGAVQLDWRPVLGLRPFEIFRRGLVHIPERREILGKMTVRENLLLGADFRPDRSGAERDMEDVLATFPRIAERLQQRAGTLSGGEQQMLAVGRALMGRPRLLMADEPSLGLAPLVVREIFHAVAAIRGRGVAVLLVEQNARAALRIADRGYVMQLGRVVMSGPAGELAGRREVVEAYLGRQGAATGGAT